jgi:hypothetical protein
MALERVFQDLCTSLRRLRDALLGLRLTAREDKPLRGDTVLSDHYGDAADDFLGWQEEALRAATEGCQCAGHPLDLNRARRALSACHESCQRLAQGFATELVCYQRIADLRLLGRTRRGEWQAWATSVEEALDRCQQPLTEVNQTLFRCWQELAERAGECSVSVQTTSIGQQVTGPTQTGPAPQEVR